MTKNLFVSAICAGIAAGLLASALQFTFVIPVLLEGELYETGARVHFGTDGSPQSDRGAPTLAGDWLRHSMTVAFNIVTYTGYGLLLAAMISFASLKGITTTAKQGLIWGLCGYIAVQLAPAIGLPPELPVLSLHRRRWRSCSGQLHSSTFFSLALAPLSWSGASRWACAASSAA